MRLEANRAPLQLSTFLHGLGRERKLASERKADIPGPASPIYRHGNGKTPRTQTNFHPLKLWL